MEQSAEWKKYGTDAQESVLAEWYFLFKTKEVLEAEVTHDVSEFQPDAVAAAYIFVRSTFEKVGKNVTMEDFVSKDKKVYGSFEQVPLGDWRSGKESFKKNTGFMPPYMIKAISTKLPPTPATPFYAKNVDGTTVFNDLKSHGDAHARKAARDHQMSQEADGKGRKKLTERSDEKPPKKLADFWNVVLKKIAVEAPWKTGDDLCKHCKGSHHTEHCMTHYSSGKKIYYDKYKEHYNKEIKPRLAAANKAAKG